MTLLSHIWNSHLEIPNFLGRLLYQPYSKWKIPTQNKTLKPYSPLGQKIVYSVSHSLLLTSSLVPPHPSFPLHPGSFLSVQLSHYNSSPSHSGSLRQPDPPKALCLKLTLSTPLPHTSPAHQVHLSSQHLWFCILSIN